MEATQTPLIDLLRDIPADARLIYEHSPTHSQSIPVGRLTAEASAELARLRAEVERIDDFEDWLANRAGPLLHIEDVRAALTSRKD